MSIFTSLFAAFATRKAIPQRQLNVPIGLWNVFVDMGHGPEYYGQVRGRSWGDARKAFKRKEPSATNFGVRRVLDNADGGR